MTKLEELAKICKCSVWVTINEHTSNYETIEEYLRGDRFSSLTSADKQAIIDAGTIVEVQAYPRTPIGFILSVHHDLDTALNQAIKWAKEY